MRTTKIVAPLVAMALCTPNIAIAQEKSNPKTISSSTDVNGNFTLTRSISVTNGNNSIPQDSKTIYVNPGDTINVKLDLKGKTATANHGFTSFTEEVSPIQASSAISGSLTVKKNHSTESQSIPLDKLNYGTFGKTGEKTIQFKATSPSGFGEVGNQVTIAYSYTAGDKLGEYRTQFKPDDQKFGLKTSDAEKLNLTIVVKDKEENRPPRGEGEQPAPPDQGEQPTPPESNRSTGFSLLTKALGVLAFLGGTVWFIIKHIFRL